MREVQKHFSEINSFDYNDNNLLWDGMHSILSYWLSDPTFYFWICSIVVCVCCFRDSWIWIPIINVGLLAGYFYLYNYGKEAGHE